MSDALGLLVVGGGPAGLAAARAYRDAGGGDSVAIVSDEDRAPYNRPPLTKELLRGEMAEDELAIEDDAWFAAQRVDLVGGRAVALDPERRELTLSGGRSLGYRSCVLATGAEPVRPPLPGVDHPAVRVVRSLHQFRELESRLAPGGEVAVIGSGFIGCEIAASLAIRGQRVILLSDESAPNVARLGPAAAERIAGWLAELGIELRFDAPVQRIGHDESGCEVHAGERSVRTGLVVLAAGVAPRSELLAPTQTELVEGAIPVDATMRSALDGVLAAGDVAYAENLAAGRALRVEHWGDALGQGAVAGASAAGATAHWASVPGFWSAIGSHTLKYAAWGDGYDECAFAAGVDGGFTVRYGRDGRLVGLLAHEDDAAYEWARDAIALGESWRD